MRHPIQFKRLFRYWPLTVIIATLALALRAAPASATGSCAQDLFTAAGNSQTLNCKSGDVSITGASNPRNPDGSALTTCIAGTKFNVIVDFNVASTSTSSRSNVGLYLGTIPVGEAGSSALTGTCDNNILSMAHVDSTGTSCTLGTTPDCLGDNNYTELDGNPAVDNCGDAAAKSLHVDTVELDGVTCPNVGTSSVVLPDCTTWQVPGKTINCLSNPGAGWPFVPTAAIPGSPSKCNCGQVSIPITPINPTIGVKKTVTPASIVEPGGTFHYTAVVTNTTAGAVDVTINQLCDDQFGNIATATTTPPQPACAAGKLCPAGTPNCASSVSCTVPQMLAQNGQMTCTFDGAVTGTEPTSVKDTVTAHGVSGGAALPPASDSATVTIGEAGAAAQLTKSLDGGQACATARYKVKVDNISAAGTDETEAVTQLLDTKFGNISALGPASANPTVVGTTCGVAVGTAGLGTLSNATGAGVLGTSIAVGGSYTCEFDGKFCAALSTGICTSGGLENTDMVTATLTQEDGICSGGTNPGSVCTSNADCGTGGTCPLTLTATGSLTVDACFSHTP
jgi:hypothetical protein